MGLDKDVLAEIESKIKTAVGVARIIVPKDTGKMRYNSLRWRRVNDTTFEVYMDLKIAPYVPYVNEPLDGHHTPKQLANEDFWERVVQSIFNQLKSTLAGDEE